jgi:hypothetical protein
MARAPNGQWLAMDDERDEPIPIRPGIRGGEGLANSASSPEAAPGTPSDLGRDSLRGDGLAEEAAQGDAESATDADDLGRDSIRGDGLAEDA